MKAVEALRIEVEKLKADLRDQRTKEKELRMALGETRAKFQEADRNFRVLKELADVFGYCRPELQVARMDAVEAAQKVWAMTKGEANEYLDKLERGEVNETE